MVESYKIQLASYIINIRINICKCKFLVNRWKKKKRKEKATWWMLIENKLKNGHLWGDM